MKTGLSSRMLRVLLFAAVILPIITFSQGAEKQKIINVITGEVDAGMKRIVQNGRTRSCIQTILC